MRYPASEKLEIIRIVERSHLPIKQTFAKIGFTDGAISTASLGRLVSRIDVPRGEVIELALDKPDLSPRELAVTFTDECSYFVSEAYPNARS